MSDIVLLDDIRIVKQRKKDELFFYNGHLTTLYDQRLFLDAEINLTVRIIDMIRKELL